MINLKDKLKITPKVAEMASRATQILFYLLIISVPFSIRYVFDSTWNFQTGAYSDFTSISIYLSDLLIIALIGTSWISGLSGQPVPKLWKKSVLLLIIWIIFELVINKFAPLELYFSIRLGLLLLLTITVSKISVSREKISWLFTILGAVQALIALIQFYTQHSLGLYRLGESHLTSNMFGVAKIVSGGITLIRGYGTFPHPNLLAAFLFTTTLFNLYLLNKTLQLKSTKYHVVILLTTLLTNIFGLFLTFSRGGILALGLVLIAYLGYFLITKQYSIFKQTIVSCGTALVISIVILLPYLSTRTTISDPAIKERVFYNQVGLRMVQDQPIVGQGLGLSVLHMKQFSQDINGIELNPWEIQPIHNYYLISYAELGIGAIFLIFTLVFPLYLAIKKRLALWEPTLISIFAGYLVLFFLDHYFYTIWPTMILLWVILGFVLKEGSTWNHNEYHSTQELII